MCRSFLYPGNVCFFGNNTKNIIPNGNNSYFSTMFRFLRKRTGVFLFSKCTCGCGTGPNRPPMGDCHCLLFLAEIPSSHLQHATTHTLHLLSRTANAQITPTGMATIKKDTYKITNVGKDVERNWNSYALLVGM